MNPHTSPWNKPKPLYIQDVALRHRWKSIKQWLTSNPSIIERNDFIEINGICYIAKHSSKMRIKSHLDWCWYDAKTLAQAIDSNNIENYYEVMLGNIRSDPNLWKDRDFEMTLKSLYAARAGRASLINGL